MGTIEGIRTVTPLGFKIYLDDENNVSMLDKLKPETQMKIG